MFALLGAGGIVFTGFEVAASCDAGDRGGVAILAIVVCEVGIQVDVVDRSRPNS